MYRDVKKKILDNVSKNSIQICLDENKMVSTFCLVLDIV